MNVLSLFDGISCGQIALERVGIKIDKYYASEIKKKAIEITQEHYPNTIQLGDVTKLHYENGKLYTEIEKGQTLPLGYLKNCSYNQMCDLAGDGWTVDIIAHIFSYLESKGE